MRIPTILGTRYFRDRSRCHIRVRRPQKRRNNFALSYTKMNKNFRKEYAYSPSWAPGITGTKADVILMFGDLKQTQK